MKVMVCGLRGFPGVQGGVETHSQHLYPLLVSHGFDVTVLARKPYHSYMGEQWNGVKFVSLWAPLSSSLEAIVHTTLCVLYAGIKRPDILHVHAIGPALVVPLAKLFGLNVVVTHHGPDYDREKWGGFARRVLKMGERFGMKWSNRRIVISEVISQLVLEKYDVNCDIVYNGVTIPDITTGFNETASFGLTSGKYVLLVSRLVPEKRHLDLISAFKKADLPGWKLVLVGGADHGSAYERKIKQVAEDDPAICCPGFLKGEQLREIYANAGIFVLPSSHEGLPIALLEAMSFGLLCIASDIPAHLCVSLPRQQIFRLGDVNQLAEALVKFSTNEWTDTQRAQLQELVGNQYNWPKIAEQTAEVYRQANI